MLNESNTPNEIKHDNDKLYWYDKDARAFGFIGDDCFISDYKGTHADLIFKYGKDKFEDILGKIDIIKLKDTHKLRKGLDYTGRIWDDKKIISFWNYPESNEKLTKLLYLLKKEDKAINYQDYLVSLPTNEFISVDKFENKGIKQDTDIDHLDTTRKKKVPEGIGSRKYKPIELKYKLYQESKDMERVYERMNTIMKVPSDVKKFHRLFSKAGFKLFVVGGAVRDYLLGKTPHDYDLVTNALPDEVVNIFKDYRTDITGVHFGVVRVYTENEPAGYEIASYRKDIAKGRNTKGNDKKVEVGKHLTIKDDVKRRDLTINALFYDLDNHQIIDVVGGISDLRNNIIRAVGVPHKRFEEDRLRILRAIRFAAVTGGKIDKETSDAIHKDNRLFGISPEDDVSRERIFKEFKDVKDKARSNNDPAIMTRFIDLLIDYNVLSQIFPVLVTNKSINPTTYLTVGLAQTLRNNKPNDKFIDTLVEAKIPGNYVKIISFLIKIFRDGVTKETAYELHKEMKSKGVRNDILEDWIRVMGITDPMVTGILNYTPSTSGKEVTDDGFRGADIGTEIRRREGEKYYNMVHGVKEKKIIKIKDFI